MLQLKVDFREDAIYSDFAVLKTTAKARSVLIKGSVEAQKIE